MLLKAVGGNLNLSFIVYTLKKQYYGIFEYWLDFFMRNFSLS